MSELLNCNVCEKTTKISGHYVICSDCGTFQESPTQWRSIETAPKEDGKRVLLFGRWEDDFRCIDDDIPDMRIGYWSNFNRGWINLDSNYLYPTHWMPLPERPEVE